jgi:hypothetical protein
MIWARWRGGNPGRSAGPAGRLQEVGQTGALVAPADPPDGRGMALGADGQGLDRLARRDGEEDLGPLDLIPGQRPTPGDLLEDRSIVGSDLQGSRSSATHGAAPRAGRGDQSQPNSRPEFLALLSSRPTRAAVRSSNVATCYVTDDDRTWPARCDATSECCVGTVTVAGGPAGALRSGPRSIDAVAGRSTQGSGFFPRRAS